MKTNECIIVLQIKRGKPISDQELNQLHQRKQMAQGIKGLK